MRSIPVLLLLCALALPAYATDSAWIDRDGVTTSLVLTPANLGAATAAQGAKADSALQSANYKVKNVLTLGILNNGSDQGAAINTLLAAAVDGDAFYFPAGTYGHSVPIVLGDKMIKVYGDGPHATFFKALGTMTNGIYRAASSSVVYRCELSDFGILGEKNVSYGVKIEAWKQAKLNRLYIEDVLVDGMLLGQNGTSGSANMFYEAQISEIDIYQKTGGWLPDPSLRIDKGLHLLNSASDNDISRVVVAYAKTAGIHDEAYGNNRYSHIHPWGNATYPMQFGMLAGGAVSISQGEFDTQSVAGVKLSSASGGVTVTGSQFINGTPTGVIVQDNTPNVFIAGNYYDSSVSTAYTIYGTATKGANFTFIDKGVAVIPGLSSNTTGTAAGLSATLATASGGTGSTDFAYNTSTHNKMASFAGTVGAGQCVQTDVSGNLTTTGSACGTGSGSGITALTGDVAASGTGSVAATVISGSTTQAGKVQLTDSTSSTSTTTAATPNSVKNAYDLAATKAPNDATYIMQTASSGTSAEQALSSLSTGFLRVTTGTGVLSSDTNTYYKSGDNATFGRVVVSGSSLASGTSPIAIFPTATNADVFNFGGTNQNLDASTGTYKAGFNANMNVVPTAAKSDEYYGVRVAPVVKASGGTSYDLATYKGISVQPQTDSGYGGTISNMYGIEIAGAAKNGGSATYGTQYGLRVQNITTGGTNYSIYTGTGAVRFGDNVTATADVAAKTFTPTIPAATTYASTTIIDLAAGDSPSVTLAGNPTLAFSNPKAGQWHLLDLIQGSGGNTVTWPSTGLVCTWRNADGTSTAPTLLSAAGSHTFILIHTKTPTSADCYAR